MEQHKLNLTRNILIGMAAGLVLGQIVNLLDLGADSFFYSFFIDGLLSIGGSVFVASLKLLVVPLVFVSLVCGAANLGDGNSMGRMGGKAVGLYMLTTGVAITLALLIASIVQPGEGMSLAQASTFAAKEAPSLKEVIINIFPSNPIKAMAEGNMLQVIVFAILVGVAIARCGEVGQRVASTMRDWNEIIMKMVLMLMQVAPYGVFCLITTLFAVKGIGIIGDLAAYFLTVVFVLLLHAFGTFTTLLTFIGRLNPVLFLRKMRSVMLFAFSTASSNATMPVTLNAVEKRLGVNNSVASFTVPLGATINMDGTAIMQGVATVFIAQAYNIDIGLTGYLLVIATATLASIGTAGVPGVGLITLALVLQQVGLPVDGIALIIGVDRLLDMTRTAVNVTGDAMVSCIVAKSEGRLDETVFNDVEAGLDNQVKSATDSASPA